MYSLQCPYFNLDDIYSSGQACRWKKINKGKYLIPHKDKVLYIVQEKGRIILYCTEDEFYEVWWEYFNFSKDYEDIYFNLKKETKLKKIIESGKNIHLLKQDPWEILLSALLGDNYLKKMLVIEKLCKAYGDKNVKNIQNLGRTVTFTLPSPDLLLRHKKELKIFLKSKSNVVIQACEWIVKENLSLDELNIMSYQDIVLYLKDFAIPKVVIDKLCLNSFGFSNIFPENEIAKIFFNKIKMSKDEFVKYCNNSNNKTLKENIGLVSQQINFKYYKREMRV